MQGEKQQAKAVGKSRNDAPERVRGCGLRLFLSFHHLWVFPCLIVAVVWIESYSRHPIVRWNPLYEVTSARGYLTVRVYDVLPHGAIDEETRELSSGRTNWGEKGAGRSYLWLVFVGGGLTWLKTEIRAFDFVQISYFRLWMITLLGLIPWLRWIGRVRQQIHLSRIGLCATCGYDLRASKERCPECGTAIPTDTAAKVVQ